MTFEVQNASGTYVDIMPFVITNGISWKRTYIAGQNGMTMQDGTTILDRIAAKHEWTFAFKPMTAADQAALLALLNPERVTVKHTDPETNTVVFDVFYVSEVPASYLIQRTDGTEYWGGMTATFSAR